MIGVVEAATCEPATPVVSSVSREYGFKQRRDGDAYSHPVRTQGLSRPEGPAARTSPTSSLDSDRARPATSLTPRSRRAGPAESCRILRVGLGQQPPGFVSRKLLHMVTRGPARAPSAVARDGSQRTTAQWVMAPVCARPDFADRLRRVRTRRGEGIRPDPPPLRDSEDPYLGLAPLATAEGAADRGWRLPPCAPSPARATAEPSLALVG